MVALLIRTEYRERAAEKYLIHFTEYMIM